MLAEADEVTRVRPSTLEYYRRTVEEVILTLRGRCHEPLTLNDMADVAYMSEYHFSRVFRLVTGIPPVQFMHACRIEAARELLLTTDRSVTDVCFDVGYSSLGTFTTRFTELVGMSPRQLRREWNDPSPVRPPAPAADDADGAIAAAEATESARTRRAAGGHVGRLTGPDVPIAAAAVGVFRTAIPQGEPTACALSVSGHFRFGHLPDGTYYVFALAFPVGDAAAASSFWNPMIPRGCSGPIEISNGRARRPLDVHVRLPEVTDPPALWAKSSLAARALLLHDTVPAGPGRAGSS